MLWQLSIEEKGLGQDYKLPENTTVEGVSSAFVVDIYGASNTQAYRLFTKLTILH